MMSQGAYAKLKDGLVVSLAETGEPGAAEELQRRGLPAVVPLKERQKADRGEWYPAGHPLAPTVPLDAVIGSETPLNIIPLGILERWVADGGDDAAAAGAELHYRYPHTYDENGNEKPR